MPTLAYKSTAKQLIVALHDRPHLLIFHEKLNGANADLDEPLDMIRTKLRRLQGEKNRFTQEACLEWLQVLVALSNAQEELLRELTAIPFVVEAWAELRGRTSMKPEERQVIDAALMTDQSNCTGGSVAQTIAEPCRVLALCSRLGPQVSDSEKCMALAICEAIGAALSKHNVVLLNAGKWTETLAACCDSFCQHIDPDTRKDRMCTHSYLGVECDVDGTMWNKVDYGTVVRHPDLASDRRPRVLGDTHVVVMFGGIRNTRSYVREIGIAGTPCLAVPFCELVSTQEYRRQLDEAAQVKDQELLRLLLRLGDTEATPESIASTVVDGVSLLASRRSSRSINLATNRLR